jgi:cation diffusion facilitator CzcD-associated flavoprotein CzcO
MGFYAFSRRYPERARKLLLGFVEKQAPAELANFTPRYKVWDQRLCVIPDADLFESIKHGRARVVTDTIDTWTETGIRLASGTHLPADIIDTAPGLDLLWFGGMQIEVDGERVDPARAMLYKGMMVSGVPNLAFAMGYTNASWTLKADLTCQHVCRLLAHMDAKGYTRVTPRRPANIDEIPLLDFSSGYIQRAQHRIPQQGSRRPWRLYQNYALDTYELKYARVDDPVLELR